MHPHTEFVHDLQINKSYIIELTESDWMTSHTGENLQFGTPNKSNFLQKVKLKIWYEPRHTHGSHTDLNEAK